MKLFIAICYLVGIGMLGASTYFGLALGGVDFGGLMPPPWYAFGGFIGGLLPTAAAVGGMLLLGSARKLSTIANEPGEPKPVEEFG